MVRRSRCSTTARLEAEHGRAHGALPTCVPTQRLAAEADSSRLVSAALLALPLHQQCRERRPAQPDRAEIEPEFQLAAQPRRPCRQAQLCRCSDGDRNLRSPAACLLAISAAFRPAVLGNARCSLPRLSASYDERTATAFGLHNRQLAPPRLDADQGIVRDPASELGLRVVRSRLSRAVRLCGVLVMIRAVAQMTV